MRIRPHHILCLRFFRGEGYSDDFCRNMTQIKQMLLPDTLVEIAEGTDDVCAACPEKQTGCPGAAQYDARVRRLCDLHTGQVECWGDLSGMAGERIVDAGKLEEVCGSCRWAQLCRKIAECSCF